MRLTAQSFTCAQTSFHEKLLRVLDAVVEADLEDGFFPGKLA